MRRKLTLRAISRIFSKSDSRPPATRSELSIRCASLASPCRNRGGQSASRVRTGDMRLSLNAPAKAIPSKASPERRRGASEKPPASMGRFRRPSSPTMIATRVVVGSDPVDGRFKMRLAAARLLAAEEIPRQSATLLVYTILYTITCEGQQARRRRRRDAILAAAWARQGPHSASQKRRKHSSGKGRVATPNDARASASPAGRTGSLEPHRHLDFSFEDEPCSLRLEARRARLDTKGARHE